MGLTLISKYVTFVFERYVTG